MPIISVGLVLGYNARVISGSWEGYERIPYMLTVYFSFNSPAALIFYVAREKSSDMVNFISVIVKVLARNPCQRPLPSNSSAAARLIPVLRCYEHHAMKSENERIERDGQGRRYVNRKVESSLNCSSSCRLIPRRK